MRRSLAAVAAFGMLAVAAGPASATIVEADRGTFSYEEIDEELCGFEIEIVGSVTFNYRIRQGKQRHDQAYFFHGVRSFEEQLSVGDRYVTVSFRGTFNETRAVPLGDGLFQFSDVEAVSLTIRDADGRVLAREAGVIRSTYTFDTLNDDAPGGEVIGGIDSTFHGRFDDADAAICAALVPG
jgi:hypothetical protein